MRKVFLNLIDSFDITVKEKKLIAFVFKRLLLAFIPASFLVFISSVIERPFLSGTFVALGNMWVILVMMVTCGAVCRAVFLKMIRGTKYDITRCVAFSYTSVPAYILIPAIVITIGLVLKVTSIGILFLGNIPWFGEIIIPIMFSPLLLIETVALFVFGSSILFAPAIIASEEEGVIFTFKRIISILNYVPLPFFLSFFLIFFSTLLFMLFMMGTVFIALPSFAGVSKFIMEDKFLNMVYVALGNLSPYKIPTGATPFTYYVGSFIFYISMGFLTSITLTLPFLYLCTSSVAVYNHLRVLEVSYRKGGEEPIWPHPYLLKIAEDKSTICPHCGKIVSANLRFCVHCGKEMGQEEE